MKVLVGTNTRESGGTTYSVASGVIHEDYNATTSINDLGILMLSENIAMTNGVKTTSLSTSIIGAKSNVIAIEWGFTNWPGAEDFPDKLQKVHVLSISVPDCQKVYKNHGDKAEAVWDGQLCTETKLSKGICPGDSGGPLISSDGKQVGIASWVSHCAEGLPDVFTRISKYIDWIKANSKV